MEVGIHKVLFQCDVRLRISMAGHFLPVIRTWQW